MKLRRGAALALALATFAIGRAASPPPPLILISLDAFRWDYCALHPAETPHLRQLAREGAAARALIPVFPSNTFPNHYSIVTGLYPSHHGIINNHIFDSVLGEFFHYNQLASARDHRWWGGEPVWITAVKQGRKSACSFWPGSEAEIAGVRPTFWKSYDYAATPFAKRLDELIGWLHLPAEQRPAIVAFYLEETNTAGHKFGADSPETTAAIQLLDGQVGEVMDRLRTDRIDANLVVVSDHGMTPCSVDRVIILEDYLDFADVQADFDGTVAGLRPLTGDTAALLRALTALPPHAKVYRAGELPARFHVDARNPRVPPVWIVADEGWHLDRRAWFNAKRDDYMKGEHGYDPALDSMHGILIAQGPSFKSGVTVGPVENVHIYNLLCAALGLTPAPNDGDDRLVHTMLR
jgi:predicted AlkP superfamily pyrophosphatase or phosphodiesterase